MVNEKKQKFVILSRGRTGSTYFVGALKKHPEIFAGAEILSNEPNPFMGATYEPNTDSWEFAEKYLYENDAINEPVRGFKLFYFHCRKTEASRRIWRELESRGDVAVITLHRKNTLAAYISSLRARKIKRFHPKSEVDRYLEKTEVDVDIDHLSNWLSIVEEQYAIGDHLRRRQGGCAIFYEDFEEYAETALNRIAEYLGADPDAASWPQFLGGTANSSMTVIRNLREVSRLLEKRNLGWMVEPYVP